MVDFFFTPEADHILPEWAADYSGGSFPSIKQPMNDVEYNVTANVIPPGKGNTVANQAEVMFEATSKRKDHLPNAAKLLPTSLATCILKKS